MSKLKPYHLAFKGQWYRLSEQLNGRDATWASAPVARSSSQSGEQAAFYILDPCGYVLEFKASFNITSLFTH